MHQILRLKETLNRQAKKLESEYTDLRQSLSPEVRKSIKAPKLMQNYVTASNMQGPVVRRGRIMRIKKSSVAITERSLS